MNKIYKLKNAITRNATGDKYNIIASPAKATELYRYKFDFKFDFLKRLKEGYIVYKFHIEDEPTIIQGLAAFRPTLGILECINMETNNFNKHGNVLYAGVGKAIIAFCCKYSQDNGMNGCIYFESKNKLLLYYQRFGAKNIFGLKMLVDQPEAQKLIDLYF